MAGPRADQLIKAIESGDYIGFCTVCGAEHEGVDMDARNDECEECGSFEVFGAAELLLSLV